MWNSDWTSGQAYADAQAADLAHNLATPVVSASSDSFPGVFFPGYYDGEKYPGGLSAVNELFELDYWALRARSNELFHKNAYARGIIRRLVTNVINTGLHLEATPDESVIGVPEDSLLDWSEDVETRFFIYSSTPEIIDNKRNRNGGELQRVAKTESLVGGDALIVLRQHPRFKLPVVQIIPGERIQTPYDKLSNDNIVDGVEMDANGRHVAFYIKDEKNPLKYAKVLARGKNTGRPQAKLLYGCDKREDGVRGVPILGIAIQPLAEIDRYKDAAQRKATLNSIVVAAVERGPGNKRKSKPLTGKGASRRDTEVEVVTDSGTSRTISFADMVPGLNIESLNNEEKVTFFNNNGVDMNFGAFEAAIIMGVAWALEIPPEILLLSFNKNYSASQAAINEFKMYLDKERRKFGAEYCDFLYQDWFLSMSLLGKIDSKTYVQDYMSVERWDAARAWTMADWSGHMKPSTDMLKAVNGYARGIEEGLITRSRVSRELYGMKYSRVYKQLAKENAQWVEANRPLAQFEKDFGQGSVEAMKATINAVPTAENEEILEAI